MRQRVSIILLSLWLAFNAISPMARADDPEHKGDTTQTEATADIVPTLPGSRNTARTAADSETFWKDPTANLPSDKDALLAALADPISHRQALQLRQLLDGTSLADWQRELIAQRLTVYASDLGDGSRVPAPELSDEARAKFAEEHLRGLSDKELQRELEDLSRAGDELVAHAGASDELTRIRGALEALRDEELRRSHPELLAHRGSSSKTASKSAMGGGGSSGGGGGSGSGLSGGGATFSFTVPPIVIPTAPRDLVLNFDNDGTPREPKRDPEFAPPVVFAPLLPALRKLGGKPSIESANGSGDH